MIALLGVVLVVILLVKLKSEPFTDIVNELPKNGNWTTRPMTGVTDITLHHTATPRSTSIVSIANGHANRFKFAIAYHFLIKDNKLYKVNEPEAYTYHNGYNNKKAISIAVMGNFSESTMTAKEKDLIVKAAKWIKKKYPSIVNFNGHKEYENATECPGNNTDVSYFRRQLNLNLGDTYTALGFAQGITEPMRVKEFADN